MPEKDFIDELFEKSSGKLMHYFSQMLKNKAKLAVITTFILGLILRLMAARNLGVFPDDANHAVNPIGIFGSGQLVNWGQSTALWYYIEGVFYTLFGPTTFASRFATVLFGSFSIILMYLFVKKVFKSEKAAIASSFLIAVSPILIKHTLPEMDIAAGFFLIASAYFLFSYFESKAKKDLILSAMLIGIATMIKFYALFFAISFFVYLICKQLDSDKKIIPLLKKVFLFGIIVLIFVTPTFAHNILLYSDKGFMDLEFTNILGLGTEKAAQYYSWGAGWKYNVENWTDIRGFFLGHQRHFASSPLPGFINVAKPLLRGDPIIFILGLLGLILIFKKHKNYVWFLLITLLPAYTFLGSNIPMTKHLMWVLFLLAPPAGACIGMVLEKIKKIKLEYVLLIVFIFSLFCLGLETPSSNGPFYGESAFSKLVEYKNSEIQDNALVVVDSRIYRGYMHWGMAGTNYIEASQFFQLIKEPSLQSGQQEMPVYYIECVTDDCGWGYIASQPEFNQSMEEATKLFANYSYAQEDFNGPNLNYNHYPFSKNKITEYRVYKLNLALNPEILKVAKQTHVWFLYPIGYDRSISPVFDDYETKGLGTLLNGFAWAVHYFELVFAFFTIFYITYLFITEKEEQPNETVEKPE